MSPRINKKNNDKSKQKRTVEVDQQQNNDVELQNKERFYQSVLENSSNILAVITADGTLRYESPSMEVMFGYSPD